MLSVVWLFVGDGGVGLVVMVVVVVVVVLEVSARGICYHIRNGCIRELTNEASWHAKTPSVTPHSATRPFYGVICIETRDAALAIGSPIPDNGMQGEGGE